MTNTQHLHDVWKRGYSAGFAGVPLDPPKTATLVNAFRDGYYVGKGQRDNLIAKGIDPSPPKTTKRYVSATERRTWR